jgi:hypothetical protein
MSFKNLPEYHENVSITQFRIPAHQQAQIDKIYEDYSYNFSLDNFPTLTSDSHQQLQHELDDLESNLESLIYVLEHSDNTTGGNLYSSKYLFTEDFISKYSK